MKSLIAALLLFGFSAQAANSLEEVARVRSLVNREAARNGPNCWNAALYTRGLVSGIRHVDGHEFTAWLSSPLCEEVPEAQAISGDIVALRRVTRDGKLVKGPYGAEIHGYLLGSDGLGFTKNGTNQKDSYHFEETASIFRIYQATNVKDCRMLGLPKETCILKAQYFRCDPSRLVWDEKLQPLAEKISVLEMELHAFYLQMDLPSESLKSFRQATVARVESLREELTKLEALAVQDWQLELLDARLASASVFLF